MAVVFDTNIIVSAVLYGGVPRMAVRASAKVDICIITSPALQQELERILSQKFDLSPEIFSDLLSEMLPLLRVVEPEISINILRDKRVCR